MIKSVKNFLTFVCIVRRELNKSKEELTVVVQDDDGGIGAASLWVVLYDLLQQIDEVVPSNDNKPTTSSNKDFGKLGVFRAVNDLRKQRSKVINTFTNYKLLFEMLQCYAQYKSTFEKVRPENEIPIEYLLTTQPNRDSSVYVMNENQDIDESHYENCS